MKRRQRILIIAALVLFAGLWPVAQWRRHSLQQDQKVLQSPRAEELPRSELVPGATILERGEWRLLRNWFERAEDSWPAYKARLDAGETDHGEYLIYRDCVREYNLLAEKLQTDQPDWPSRLEYDRPPVKPN